MKNLSKILMLAVMLFYMTSCATIVGGKVTTFQKTKPEVVDALFDSLSKTASGKRIIESVSNARKELKGNALKVEVLAQAVGEYSALDVLTKKAYSSSFRTALANFFREITNVLKRFFGGKVSIKDINENTKLVWVETPTNPLMKLAKVAL